MTTGYSWSNSQQLLSANSARNPIACCEGPDGNIWFVSSSPGSNAYNFFGVMTHAGVPIAGYPAPSSASTTSCASAQGICSDGTNLWATDINNSRILRCTPAGVVTAFPGMGAVLGICLGPDGNLWVASQTGTRVASKISTAGVLLASYSASGGGVGSEICSDGTNVWVTNDGNGAYLFKVTPAGVVTQYNGAFEGHQILYNGINFYSAGHNSLGNGALTYEVTPAGVISTLATLGTASQTNSAGLALGKDGNLYQGLFATGIDRIEQVTLTGVVSTAYNITGGPATGSGACAAANGDLFFCDDGTTGYMVIGTWNPPPTGQLVMVV